MMLHETHHEKFAAAPDGECGTYAHTCHCGRVLAVEWHIGAVGGIHTDGIPVPGDCMSLCDFYLALADHIDAHLMVEGGA